MDNYLYNTYQTFFHTLSTLGYVNKKSTDSLLILDFLYNIASKDYRGFMSKEDYHTIERALNCLYGSTCLIPYPDYLKMGKLRLGDMTELASRTKKLEGYSEELDKRILDNDVLIEDSIRRIDEHGTRLDNHDAHLAMHDRHLAQHDVRLDAHDVRLDEHDNILVQHGTRLNVAESRLDGIDAELYTDPTDKNTSRLTRLEDTKVAKGKNLIQEIDPIVFDLGPGD